MSVVQFVTRKVMFLIDVAGKFRLGTVLEATQGQMGGFFSQLPYKCHLEEVASVGDGLEICPWVTSRVGCVLAPRSSPVGGLFSS